MKADEFTNKVDSLMSQYCYSCHDEDVQKGDLRLDQLGQMSLDARLNLLNKVQEQVYLKHMPPKKKKQPTTAERGTLIKWVEVELKKHNASKLEDKLRKYEYANYVDHDELFSGEYKHLKGYTNDRRWLVSEHIFNNKINRLAFSSQAVHPGSTIMKGLDVTNPFLQPKISGVRYYDSANLSGEHLLTMVSNARKLSIYLTEKFRDKTSYIPSFGKLMEQEYAHQATLNSREKFLSNSMEQLLINIYGQKSHQELLPKFKSVVSKEYLEAVKKTPSLKVGKPAKLHTPTISRTIQKYDDPSRTNQAIVHECEKEWFYTGHDPRQVRSWTSYLYGDLEAWRHHVKRYNIYNRYKPIVYKELNVAEMKIVIEMVKAQRQKGDSYYQIKDKCLALWEKKFSVEREKNSVEAAKWLTGIISESFLKLYNRLPGEKESKIYVEMLSRQIEQFGRLGGVQKLLQTLILRSEFVYREEFGVGEPDQYGRRLLSPFQASYALSYALTETGPDEELKEAAQSGKLKTREDYQREVTRLLKKRDQQFVLDSSINGSSTRLPVRKLRFFREFFGYPNMLAVFKDDKRFGGSHKRTKNRLLIEADMLVEHILKEDKNVIEKLLNTEKFYVFHSGNNEAMKNGAERMSLIYQQFKDKPWKDFTYEDLMKHSDFMKKLKMRGDPNETNVGSKKRILFLFKKGMEKLTARFAAGQRYAAPYPAIFALKEVFVKRRLGQKFVEAQVAHYFNLPLAKWDYAATQPFKLENRKGILTHPAWLIAHAQNTETDPVRRGKWIREKLLAGTIPEIPITVDAAIPENHHKTLRTRLDEATTKKYCWRCHVQMNPLGTPFEIYDDFGRFRKQESLEHIDNLIKKVKDKGEFHEDLRDIFKSLPVNATGALEGTGDKKLDGKVENALDLIDRLSRSDRVRQSVIRNAFRYFMGRNERLKDSQTLIEADKAYLESGGSFDAVIISLLTSDSFIYRKPVTQ